MGYSAKKLFPVYQRALGGWIPPLGSQLVEEIGTKFQRLPLCLRGPATQWKYYECCLTKPEVGNPTIKPPSWISDFRFMSHSIQTTSIELLDPENMGVAVGISFLSHLQAEILGGWQPPPP